MPRSNMEESKELAKNSTDCSFLLTHLIRQNDGRTQTKVENIFSSIFDIPKFEKPILKGSPAGWYGTSSADVFDPKTSNIKTGEITSAVCFTESTLAGLRAHRDLFKVSYGIAFDRDHLFEKGANPCINIRQSILKEEILRDGEMYPRHLYQFIPSTLRPYVNIINESFDATHEREWRFNGDMEFSIHDVKFIFCPEEKFEIFNSIQMNGLPCLFDLDWLDRV